MVNGHGHGHAMTHDSWSMVTGHGLEVPGLSHSVPVFKLISVIDDQVHVRGRQKMPLSNHRLDGLFQLIRLFHLSPGSHTRAPRSVFVKPSAGGRTLAAILRMSMSHLHVLEETQV